MFNMKTSLWAQKTCRRLYVRWKQKPTRIIDRRHHEAQGLCWTCAWRSCDNQLLVSVACLHCVLLVVQQSFSPLPSSRLSHKTWLGTLRTHAQTVCTFNKLPFLCSTHTERVLHRLLTILLLLHLGPSGLWELLLFHLFLTCVTLTSPELWLIKPQV